MDIKKVIKYSVTVRGAVLHETIGLERKIDWFLAQYFCPGNESRWFELVNIFLATNRTTFDSKREAMKYITKTHYPDFAEKLPSFLNDVEIRIMPKRNIIAHCNLYMGEDAIEAFKNRSIGFVKHLNENEIKWYSVAEIDDLINLTIKCTDDLTRYIKQQNPLK